ncbi:MAG TPA: hypothetical protein DER68_02140 [Ruminococcaceae bacterium]|nr:hypothetical protein [Oscillospiraceae bacterium]
MSEKSELHSGHRKRMLERFLAKGIDCFEEHEILEVLLFSIFTRCNTNEISHRLIGKFGSLMNVLSASKNDLMTVSGVGENAAGYICFLGEFFTKFRSNAADKRRPLNSPEKLAEYAKTLFTGSGEETAYVVLLDRSLCLVGSEKIAEGLPDVSHIAPKNILRAALGKKSENIVLVHNHPDGAASFSAADISATRHLINLLREIDIEMKDHIIISGENVCSMRSLGFFNEYWG